VIPVTLNIRTYHEIENAGSDLGDQVAAQQTRVEARLALVHDVVGIMSGKGGVGKSLLTAALATLAARRGRRVGVLDADLNGPSMGRMLGCPRGPLAERPDGIDPASTPCGALVMSMDLLLDADMALHWKEPDGAAFVWRGVQERGAVREFLADVGWGELDLLLVDLPPGVGRLAELHELVPELSGVLAVTIPSAASRDAVARSLELAARRRIPLLGLVENLRGYRCDGCGDVGALFGGDAAERLARRFDVPVLGGLPFDPTLDRAAAYGELDAWLSAGGPTAIGLGRIGEALDAALGAGRSAGEVASR